MAHICKCNRCGQPFGNGATRDDDHIIYLSPEDFDEFHRILAEPPEPNDKLVNLLRGYTIVSQRQS